MARDETQISHSPKKRLKPSEEADMGPLTSSKLSDEIQTTLTDEIKKLKSLEEGDSGASTSNKPLIQEVTSIFRLCYSEEECRRYFKPIYVSIGPLSHQEKTQRDLRFERGQKLKLRLATMFIIFSTGTEQDFYKNVKKKINSLRNCYNFKGQKWTDEELAWMFMVDGCALLHFIILDMISVWEAFRVSNGLASIEKVDFFLLDNQLPYQLLEILIDSFAEFSTVESKQELKKSFKKFNKVLRPLLA